MTTATRVIRFTCLTKRLRNHPIAVRSSQIPAQQPVTVSISIHATEPKYTATHFKNISWIHAHAESRQQYTIMLPYPAFQACMLLCIALVSKAACIRMRFRGCQRNVSAIFFNIIIFSMSLSSARGKNSICCAAYIRFLRYTNVLTWLPRMQTIKKFQFVFYICIE